MCALCLISEITGLKHRAMICIARIAIPMPLLLLMHIKVDVLIPQF